MMEPGPGRVWSFCPFCPSTAHPCPGAGCFPGQQEPLGRAGLCHLLGCRTGEDSSPLQSWDICASLKHPKKSLQQRERGKKKGCFLMEEMEEAEGAWIRSTRKAPPPFPAWIPKGKGLQG